MTNNDVAELTALGFSHKYPAGTKMVYQPVMGFDNYEDVTIRGEAWVLGSGSILIKVKERTGGLDITHLTEP